MIIKANNVFWRLTPNTLACTPSKTVWITGSVNNDLQCETRDSFCHTTQQVDTVHDKFQWLTLEICWKDRVWNDEVWEKTTTLQKLWLIINDKRLRWTRTCLVDEWWWIVTTSHVLWGEHYKVKDRKNKKELDWHHKTRFTGHWHVLWGSTRVLCWQRRLTSMCDTMCLWHGMNQRPTTLW